MMVALKVKKLRKKNGDNLLMLKFRMIKKVF